MQIGTKGRRRNSRVNRYISRSHLSIARKNTAVTRNYDRKEHDSVGLTGDYRYMAGRGPLVILSDETVFRVD